MDHACIFAEQFKLNDNMELEHDGYICEICGEKENDVLPIQVSSK